MVNNGMGISLEYDGNMKIVTRPGQRANTTNWKITMPLMGESTISTGPFSIAVLIARGYVLDSFEIRAQPPKKTHQSFGRRQIFETS